MLTPILLEDLSLNKFGGIFHRYDYNLHDNPNMIKCKHSYVLKVEKLFKMPINKTKIPDKSADSVTKRKKIIQFKKQ